MIWRFLVTCHEDCSGRVVFSRVIFFSVCDIYKVETREDVTIHHSTSIFETGAFRPGPSLVVEYCRTSGWSLSQTCLQSLHEITTQRLNIYSIKHGMRKKKKKRKQERNRKNPPSAIDRSYPNHQLWNTNQPSKTIEWQQTCGITIEKKRLETQEQPQPQAESQRSEQ